METDNQATGKQATEEAVKTVRLTITRTIGEEGGDIAIECEEQRHVVADTLFMALASAYSTLPREVLTNSFWNEHRQHLRNATFSFQGTREI